MRHEERAVSGASELGTMGGVEPSVRAVSVANPAARDECVEACEQVHGLDRVPVFHDLAVNHAPAVGDVKAFPGVAAMGLPKRCMGMEDHGVSVDQDVLDVVSVVGEPLHEITDGVYHSLESVGDAVIVLGVDTRSEPAAKSVEVMRIHEQPDEVGNERCVPRLLR